MTDTALNHDPLMTRTQAAEYLAITEYQLDADRQRKREIPYIKIGRLVRYRKSGLDNYLNQQTMGGIACRYED